MKDVIEKLKDDKYYYGEGGKKFLSNSDIGTLLTNPREFGVSRPDNQNFAKGRYFHQLLIEPDKASEVVTIDSSSRNTKLYKEAIAEMGVEVALLTKEADEVVSLTETMKNNLYFFDNIYKDGNIYEEPAVKEIMGLMWKGKVDIVCDDMLIDLKTTSKLSDFKWSAKKYNYDSQAYIYQQLFNKPLIFFVIDKTSHQMGVFRPTEEFIKGGEEKVKRAVEVYNTFFGDNPKEELSSYFIDEYL